MTQPENQQSQEVPGSSGGVIENVLLEDPLIRFDARLLDPTTAVRVTPKEVPSPTVYVADTVLVTASSLVQAATLIRGLDLAARLVTPPLSRVVEAPFERVLDGDKDARNQNGGDEIHGDEIDRDGNDRDENADDVRDGDDQPSRVRQILLAEALNLPLVFPVRFEPAGDPQSATDVWPLLVVIRRAARQTDGYVPTAEQVLLSESVGLNHLMSSAAVISGNPYMKGAAAIFGNPYMKGAAEIFGNPYMKGAAGGPASYSVPGSGGRSPVSVVLPAPVRPVGSPTPRVVVLDTGIGEHRWFKAQAAINRLQYEDLAGRSHWIGVDLDDPNEAATDPEGAGAVPDPMTGLLASHAGHGTFIAGLIRQLCAAAEIIAARVMGSDGVVPELMLVDAIFGLTVLQTRALLDPPEGSPIDAVVMSLGYYSETGYDKTYTAGLLEHIKKLSELGVAVFCAAGNDSTLMPSYPAAFARDPIFGNSNYLPVASVAALNPDKTVALFSNDGDWVNAEAKGANLVSTTPEIFQGAMNPDTSFIGPNDARRGTIDADSFVSGFSTWSGTSFAAPVLAGEYLARLTAADMPPVDQRKDLLGITRTKVEKKPVEETPMQQ